ncbi:mucin-5AC-like isoform X3 [Brienomyrus brachyistius]|uniref:mucin-5AC-like isoform X2 n=1 Tax=Brienomyrus brachyistius TaxID=42636 RepID=UPI0020B2B922|nr:mucin-5AC-like isoform X2 [Brienomyrus brachyistius]XP_048860204.1 mucin-5AC-like isoform X3 [Brienomyrus brachyistius]
MRTDRLLQILFFHIHCSCNSAKMIKVILAVWTILMTKECRCANICWTQWFDRDDPSGVGDFETLQNLRQENPGKICDAPIAIQATTLSGTPASQTGQTFHNYDTTVGFACVNSENKQMCLDYQVRFQCPPSFCSVCWTQWFDRDDPSGVGDFETLQNLRQENPGKICDAPIAIQATTLSGTPASQTGQTFHNYDTTVGFACVNSENKQMCLDYQVRFQCPPSFCPA